MDGTRGCAEDHGTCLGSCRRILCGCDVRCNELIAPCVEECRIDFIVAGIGYHEQGRDSRLVGGNSGKRVDAEHGKSRCLSQSTCEGNSNAQAGKCSRTAGHCNTVDLRYRETCGSHHLSHHGRKCLGVAALHQHIGCRQWHATARVDDGGRAGAHGSVEAEDLHGAA